MGNSTSGLVTNGVTIAQVHANNGAAADTNYGTLDFDKDGASNADEFIEIKNFSDVAVNIGGWQIWTSNDGGGADGSKYHTFPAGTMLQPGQSIYVITEYTGALPAGVVEANGIGTATNTTNFLPDTNQGEIALVNTTNPANIEYVQFTMDMSPDNVTAYAGFPKDSDGTTATRVMGDPLPADASPDVLQGYIMGAQRTYGINETPQNGLSVVYDPDKGEVGYINGGARFPGSNATTQDQIDLNGVAFYEVLPDNNSGLNGFDVDGDGNATAGDQYVSFINTTGAPIDIGGYEVWSTTQTGTDDQVYLYHTFPAGTILQPGQVVYVVTDYTGNLADRSEFIFEANGAVTNDNSQLIRGNSLGEIALVEKSNPSPVWPFLDQRDYIHFTFDPTPPNLAAQNPFPGTALVGVQPILAVGEYLSGTQPTNSDTYRYDWATGLVIEIPQFVSLAVCFTTGTLIKTQSGEVAIEQLTAGDQVLTMDHGYQPIRWIGSRKLTAIDFAANPNLRPIRIRAGALGNGLPETDLIVSPQHRVLIASKIARTMFGFDEVLVAAKQLVAIDGIDVAEDVSEVTYWHFLCDDHEIVMANGAFCESLYTGEEALKSVGPEARKEIFSIFPELASKVEGNNALATARYVPNGKQARKLAERTSAKGRSLFDATVALTEKKQRPVFQDTLPGKVGVPVGMRASAS